MGERDVLVGGRNTSKVLMIVRRPEVLAVAVLAVAAVLRFVGIDYGLPHPLVSDEEILIGGTLRMAQTMSFVPSLDAAVAEQLYYPVGLPYVYLLLFAPLAGVVYAVSGFPGFGELPALMLSNVDLFFLTARALSALMSVASVWVCYRLASRMFASPAAGVLCAALLATSWFHVVLGHFARHWSATVFMVWLTVLLAWRYYESPSLRRALWCAFSAAAGFAVSYIGVLGFAAFVLAHGARYRLAFFNRQFVAGFTALAVGITVSALLHWPAITRLVGGDAPVLPVEETKTVASLAETFRFYFIALWRAEAVLLVAGIAGAVLGFSRFRWLTTFLVSAFLGYVVFLDLFMPLEDRYILPALPALALLAAGGFEAQRRWRPRSAMSRLLPLALLGAALAYSSWNAATFARLVAAEDSRELAVRWILENVAADEKVAVSLNPVKVPATRAGIELQATLAPASLDFADRYAREEQTSRNTASVRDAVHLHRFSDARLASESGAALFVELRALGVRYFVLARRHDLPPDGLLEAASAQRPAVAVFDPARDGITPPHLRTTILVQEGMVRSYSALPRLGPRVEIYDFGEAD